MSVFHHPCECSRWLTNSFQTIHKRHLPLKCLYSMKIEHFLYFGEKGRHGYDIYGYHHHKRWSRSYGNWLLTRFFIVLRWYHLNFCCGQVSQRRRCTRTLMGRELSTPMKRNDSLVLSRWVLSVELLLWMWYSTAVDPRYWISKKLDHPELRIQLLREGLFVIITQGIHHAM